MIYAKGRVWFRKLLEQIVIATSDSLLFDVAIRIRKTMLKFLIDTDASVTILPSKYANGLCLNPAPAQLSSANRQDIQYYGETSTDIDFPGFCCS